MVGGCPTPAADAPMVKALLGVVDCNVQSMVHGGYSALFAPGSAFSTLLTALLTIFVAVQGIRLMLGQTQLRVTDLALTLIKIGAILALATQWDTYQTVVYGFLFRGPEQLANAMLGANQPAQSVFRGDVFDALQQAFDALNAFATAYSQHSSISISPLLGGTAFGAMALTASATLLLLASLGVVLAAKIVLGMLLAAGPVFIALLMFDTTRGIFEGWLRAALAFAFAPLAATLLLGVGLTILEPALVQMAQLQVQNAYPLAPVYSILTLVLVFVGVSAGALIAGGMIAKGFKLPRPAKPIAAANTRGEAPQITIAQVLQPRAVRIAAAATAQERRDSNIFSIAGASGDSDRRTAGNVTNNTERGRRPQAVEVRLGQSPRRGAAPRRLSAGARSAR